MLKTNLLNIKINASSSKEVLEQIERGYDSKIAFTHIVSINPENVVEAFHNEKFKKVIETSQMAIIDGVGVAVAVQILHGQALSRTTGVDLMEDLCKMAYKRSLSVVLIGGKANLAKGIADCQNATYRSTLFYGYEGFKDIKNPTQEEISRLNSIVLDRKPSLVFASFGSPEQEIWLDSHKALFANCVCLGVGGAFDFIGGTVTRAPKVIRLLGLEWLFRLILQPWRWRRQVRLIEFIYLVVKEKFKAKST